jgi:hypothetical protein
LGGGIVTHRRETVAQDTQRYKVVRSLNSECSLPFTVLWVSALVTQDLTVVLKSWDPPAVSPANRATSVKCGNLLLTVHKVDV